MKISIPSLTITVLIFATHSSVMAASETWTGGSTTDGNWSDGSNWNGSAAPGSTSSLTSPDIATFNAAIANTWGATALNPVVIDSTSQNIDGINFDTAAGNYFIGSMGGSSLFLTSGGTTQILNTLTSTNAVETINAPLKLEGGYTLANNSANGTGAGAGTLVIGGSVAGAAAGSDTLALSGTNTNLNAISGAIGDGLGTVSLTKSGAGLWELTGTNTYSGATSINGGTLEINNSAALGNASATNTIGLNGGTLEFTTNNVTLAANQTITLSGAGALETDATYGGTGVNARTVTINSAINNGGNTLTIESLNTSGNTSTMIINGVISGSGGLTKTFGPGGMTTGANGLTLQLTGANTYSGATTITSPNFGFGSVVITAADNLGDGSVTNKINLGGTLQTTGTFDLGVNRSITLNGTPEITSTSGTLTISGNVDDISAVSWVLTGAGNINVSGAISEAASQGGQLTYSGSGTLFLTGNNVNWNKVSDTKFGLLNINGGTVNATTASLNGTGTSGDIIFGGNGGAAGGTLQAGTGGINLARAVVLSKAGTFDENGANSTISGVIQNNTTAGAFTVKDSSSGATGSLTLTGANTYTAGTTVSSGTLYANTTTAGASATGTGAVTVAAGAALGGSGKIAPGAGNGITLANNSGSNVSTLISGGIQAAVSATTQAGTGLALNNTTAATTILKLGTQSNLVFSLGFTPTPTTYNLDNPNESSTFLTITGNTTGEIAFSTSNTVTLNDLTGGQLLLGSTPYLLISAGLDTDYSGLSILNPDANGNGIVSNVALTGLSGYGPLELYLENGSLEVLAAPEPSSFALILGGAALILTVRRFRRRAS